MIRFFLAQQARAIVAFFVRDALVLSMPVGLQVGYLLKWDAATVYCT